MQKEHALEIQLRALNAVRELNAIVADLQGRGAEVPAQLRRAIGLCICHIDAEILHRLYQEFPELDDLRDHR